MRAGAEPPVAVVSPGWVVAVISAPGEYWPGPAGGWRTRGPGLDISRSCGGQGGPSPSCHPVILSYCHNLTWQLTSIYSSYCYFVTVWRGILFVYWRRISVKHILFTYHDLLLQSSIGLMITLEYRFRWSNSLCRLHTSATLQLQLFASDLPLNQSEYTADTLSSNQNSVDHRKWNFNIIFTLAHL